MLQVWKQVWALRCRTEKQICLRTGGTFGPGAADECVFVFVLCLLRNPSALASAERKNRKFVWAPV